MALASLSKVIDALCSRAAYGYHRAGGESSEEQQLVSRDHRDSDEGTIIEGK